MRLINYKQQIEEILNICAKFSREHEEMTQALIDMGYVAIRETGQLYWINTGIDVGLPKEIVDNNIKRE